MFGDTTLMGLQYSPHPELACVAGMSKDTGRDSDLIAAPGPTRYLARKKERGGGRAVTVFVIRRLMYDKEVYRRCGMDVKEAMRQARSNQQVGAIRQESFRSLYEFMEDNGLMSRVSRRFWRHYGFLE